MADNPTLQVEERTDFGKGFARRARVADKIPAVLYGHGTDPVHLLLPYHDTFLLVKDNANAVISLKGLKDPAMVLVKDIQRHPVKRQIMHMDLLLVKADEKVDVEVPIEIIGEPKSGLVANQDLLNMEIFAPVIAIPEKIEVSVDGLEDGVVLSVADIKLPEGVEAKSDPEAIVLSVTTPQEVDIPEAPTAEEETTEAETEEETEESAE
ncbi:50S ribosomal protein L25/general stress protein Ctc [uncultured Mobiluncus sp.]|uniref:50S ribosomal protein L25/general stress protein Ctc n=1 Tax=uncultured Mobiluncus sp. TaxID=293425 RepID=UPI002616E6EC|nr:50S ribosomal protein L25/general stress protein Ctc [uncultured Mobiluncus sp.]